LHVIHYWQLMKHLIEKFKVWLQSYGYAAIAVVLITGYIIFNSQKNSLKHETELNLAYSNLSDTLMKIRNHLGQEVTKSTIIKTESEKAFLSLKSKDIEIIKLQALIESEKSKGRKVDAALVLSTLTAYKLKDPLLNTVSYDSTAPHPRDTVTMWPIYTHQLKDSSQWITGTIKLGRSSFYGELEFKNEYTVSIGDERRGWFKRQPYAEIVNLNPHTTTTSLKVFQKTTVPNKVLKSSIITGIAVFLGTFFLLK
jgi:hypothetical protein